MLRLEKLEKRYRTGDLALKGVDLKVPDGQIMALIGPSGAGKSTLIRCINRLVDPTGGKVFLNDLELTALGPGPLRRARRRMGMIFQEYALVERLSVMENVLSGRLGYVGFWRSYFRRYPQSDIDEAFRLLGRVGLDHMVDKRADELSGGQRQRVGICRALAQDPELLLVDEPTASLDPKTSRQIMRLICELCRERRLSAIINIHDVMLAQMFAQRIVGLKLGEIVYDGPPDRLTAEVLTEIYGEEDWEATIRKVEDEDEEQAAEGTLDGARAHDPAAAVLDRDRLAGTN
jgi:phosphonate transport system ATP-binding protein